MNNMEIVRYHFTSLDSTNTWAKRNAASFQQEKMTLVTAEEQTAGRGRFMRKWESPKEQNVYASFCFFIEKYSASIGNIPQVMAISAFQVLAELGFNPCLKWPNDVLLSNKKAAGILCETTSILGRLCVIVGIGININMPLNVLEKIDRPATSLFAETHQTYAVEEVILSLQKQFLANITRFFEEGFSPFLTLYKEMLGHHKGDKISFHDNRIVWEGIFHSIDHEGALNLLLESGEVKTFIAGEIIF